MTEQEINNLIDSKIGKTKMSQLPEATQTSGLYSIGYNGNQSVKYKANLLQGDPLTVRKTYQTEALALADKNPIDTTTSLPLKIGQFISIVNDGEKNGIYRIGSISGNGTMSLELQGKLGDLSDYIKTSEINWFVNDNYANNTDGKINSSSLYKRTNFLKLPEKLEYSLQLRGSVSAIAFYDINYMYISSIDSDNSSSYVILSDIITREDYPENAYYFIASTLKDYSPTLKFNFPDIFEEKSENINISEDGTVKKNGVIVNVNTNTTNVLDDSMGFAVKVSSYFGSTKVLTEQGTIASATGDESSSNILLRTEFIQVVDYVYLNLKAEYVGNIQYYDNNKNHISNPNNPLKSIDNLKINHNGYIRLVIANSDLSGISPSEDIGLEITHSYNVFETIKNSNNSFYEEVIPSINLFNKVDVVQGHYIAPPYGEIVVSISRNASGKIFVKPNTQYYIESYRGISFYDLHGVSVFYDETDYSEGNIITTTEDTVYIRFSYYTDVISDDRQIMVEGNLAPPKYVGDQFTIPNLMITEENIKYLDIDNIKDGKINSFANRQDLSFVGNYMYEIIESDIEGGYGDNGQIVISKNGILIKTLRHNFGHVNSFEYAENNDALIFGSGSGHYNLDESIYIVQGVKNWINLHQGTLLDIRNNIPNSQITTIDIGREFGDKLNVIWGEDNYGQDNICYAISNDAQNFRKLLLGKGENNFDKGVFISGRTAEQYNGTYKILKEWVTPIIDVIQGGCYYNGSIYLGIGHDGLWIVKYTLSDDGTMKIEHKKEKYYMPDGTIPPISATEGLTIRNGIMYQGVITTLGRDIFVSRHF